MPLSLPKTLPSRSEHPLITSGCWVKSSTQLTNPTICGGGGGVAARRSIARHAGADLDNARDLVEVAHVPPQRSHEYEPDPLRQLRGLLRRIVEANLARVQPARGHARSALRRVRISYAWSRAHCFISSLNGMCPERKTRLPVCTIGTYDAAMPRKRMVIVARYMELRR